MKILELDSRLPVSHWPLGGASMWAGGAWSPTGREFALAGGGYGAPDWRLRIFDVATGQPESVLAGPVGTAKWSRDRTKLVFTLRSPFFEVWITDDLDNSGATAAAFRPNLAAYDQDILALYTRAIEANPEDADGLYIRAQHYQYLGDVNSAQADMNRYALLLGRQADTSGFRFGLVENLGPIVNSSTYEIRPLPTEDGLALLFGRRNPEGGFDSCLATRQDEDGPWTAPEKLSSGKPSEYIPCVTTEDGREFYLRVSDQYGFGDLAVCKRDSVEDDWGAPENLGPTVNSPACERRPAITADGLELYFMDHYSAIRPGGCGEQDLWMTRRATRNDPWEEPKNLGLPVNSSKHDGWPYISPDGLLLLFASHRPGGFGQGDVYATWRNSRDDPWEEPVNLGPRVNTRGREWAPCLSSDGLTLYFESNRPCGYGEMDLWQVQVIEMKR